MYSIQICVILLIFPSFIISTQQQFLQRLNHSSIDVLKHEILPTKLDMILTRIEKQCRAVIEIPIKKCLTHYDDHTTYLTSFLSELDHDFDHQEKTIGCCQIWQLDDCSIDLVCPFKHYLIHLMHEIKYKMHYLVSR